MNIMCKSIMTVVLETPHLAQFVKLLKRHNLADALVCKGLFTVFAPTNDAVDKARAVLSRRSAPNVVHVLKNHVVWGTYTQQNLPKKLHTLAGNTIDTTRLSIVKSDLQTNNGVVHIINDVLIPAH